jgi:transcriptional regulator of acetoin/glycerol metabolism
MQARPAPQRLPVTAALVPAPERQRREAIAQSHQRSLALGIRASALPEINPAAPAALREAHERHRRLHQQAAPVMEMLFEQIVFTHSMVVLTDPQGTILHAVGDSGFLERAQQVALAPGVNWSEASKGTNAIGTALFSEAPTLVHGSEHFVRANHFLTCSAAPILDHAGQLLGVLDVTGDQRSYHPHTLALVNMSARIIENHWINDRFRHGLRLCFQRQPEMLGTLREAMLALSPDGAILGANRSAIDLLGLSVAALRMLGLEAVFGITVAVLADHFRRGSDEPLALRATHQASQGGACGLWGRAQFSGPRTQWIGAPRPAASTPKVVPPAAAASVQIAAPGAHPTLHALEAAAIRRAVAAAGGNISLAARQLGIARNTVYRKLRAG